MVRESQETLAANLLFHPWRSLGLGRKLSEWSSLENALLLFPPPRVWVLPVWARCKWHPMSIGTRLSSGSYAAHYNSEHGRYRPWVLIMRRIIGHLALTPKETKWSYLLSYSQRGCSQLHRSPDGAFQSWERTLRSRPHISQHGVCCTWLLLLPHPPPGALPSAVPQSWLWVRGWSWGWRGLSRVTWNLILPKSTHGCSSKDPGPHRIFWK